MTDKQAAIEEAFRREYEDTWNKLSQNDAPLAERIQWQRKNFIGYLSSMHSAGGLRDFEFLAKYDYHDGYFQVTITPELLEAIENRDEEKLNELVVLQVPSRTTA